MKTVSSHHYCLLKHVVDIENVSRVMEMGTQTCAEPARCGDTPQRRCSPVDGSSTRGWL
jgi:hypothetical protein